MARVACPLSACLCEGATGSARAAFGFGVWLLALAEAVIAISSVLAICAMTTAGRINASPEFVPNQHEPGSAVCERRFLLHIPVASPAARH
jgi:hypothetical protein